MFLAWALIGALIGVAAAQKRGFSVVGGVLGGLLLGPLAFLMFFVNGVSGSHDHRMCPFRGEIIKAEATVCKECRGALPVVGPNVDRRNASAMQLELTRFTALVKEVGRRPSPRPAASAHSPVAAVTSPPMTWRTDDTETAEFRVGDALVMTASVSISTGPGFVAVVGESHYQDALQRARHSRPGEDGPVFMATLVREPHNAYVRTRVEKYRAPAS